MNITFTPAELAQYMIELEYWYKIQFANVLDELDVDLPMVDTLWNRYIRTNPSKPDWRTYLK